MKGAASDSEMGMEAAAKMTVIWKNLRDLLTEIPEEYLAGALPGASFFLNLR